MRSGHSARELRTAKCNAGACAAAQHKGKDNIWGCDPQNSDPHNLGDEGELQRGLAAMQDRCSLPPGSVPALEAIRWANQVGVKFFSAAVNASIATP